VLRAPGWLPARRRPCGAARVEVAKAERLPHQSAKRSELNATHLGCALGMLQDVDA
jgi:hypothetical protein